MARDAFSRYLKILDFDPGSAVKLGRVAQIFFFCRGRIPELYRSDKSTLSYGTEVGAPPLANFKRGVAELRPGQSSASIQIPGMKSKAPPFN